MYVLRVFDLDNTLLYTVTLTGDEPNRDWLPFDEYARQLLAGLKIALREDKWTCIRPGC